MKVRTFKQVFITIMLLLSAIALANSALGAFQDDDVSPLLAVAKPKQDQQLFRYEEGEELIFTVVIDKYILGELVGVTTKDGVAFDLENYIDVLDFPIAKVNERVYEGWFINEDNTFRLDLNDIIERSLNNVTVKDNAYSLEQGKYVFVDDILYINHEILTSIFGVKHKINYSALEIFLISTEPLPLEARLKREKQNLRRAGFNKPRHPELYRGYELLSPQVFDFLASSNYRESSDNFNYNYSLLGSRDIALVHADYYIDGSDNDLLNRARLKLSKQSVTGGLLGFMNATSVEVGDVRPYRQAFGQTEQESRGIRITNSSPSNALDNEKLTLQGPIQAGWDAELYRNGVLIDRQFDISVGQYEFIDIQLIFGINEFEIVLYGPQGQKVTEKVTKAVDQKLLSGDSLTYDISFNQINESLLGIGDFGTEEGFAFSGGVRQNLMGALSVNAGILTQFGVENDRNEINLGIDTILFNRAYLSANTRFDDENNRTLNVDARTQMFNQSLSLRLSSSTNSQNNFGDLNRAIASLAGGFSLGSGIGFSYENVADLSEQDDTKTLRFINRLGLSYNKFRIFHNLENSRVTDPLNFTTNEYLGILSIDSSLGGINARLSATYGLENDEYQALTYQGNLAWNITNNIKSRLNVVHEVKSKVNRSNLQFGWVNDRFNLSSNFGYSDDLGWDVGVSARFSFVGQNSEYDSIYNTETASTQRGTLAVRVFEDINVNGRYDEGEPLIKNAMVLASQTFSRGVTNEKGIAVLDGIPDQRATDVVIDTDTLPDPFMVPLVPGVSITFRKGLVDKLDYPISRSAEIEGMVYLSKEGVMSAGKNIPVLLKNARGRIIKAVETEFDGYYVFDKVIPGNYVIEIPKSVINHEDVHDFKSIRIKTTLESALISGIDITLEQKTYQTIFAATHGIYSNLRMLEVAKRLLQFKLLKTAPTFFYVKSKTLDGYILISFYADQQAEVVSQCELFLQKKLNCTVELIDIPYIKN
jgi:hypothetical protein